MRENQIKSPPRNIGSSNTASVLKFINAELNTPQNKVLLGLGLATAVGIIGYTTYVRHKYEQLGYYLALKEDGQTEFIKKTSNWEK
ncbi:uncharacterized protein Dmoj_GI25526 [Drosophila mojavensis]|uniref:Small integral membrane protein 8 n=1 Tax=Drosophila mojavensis TaxID=7230 RepID=A0A0Q9XMQ7_DROMO|nr:uncharacterized protein Dmoj_GI25526 [Drosophila mojavensis]